MRIPAASLLALAVILLSGCGKPSASSPGGVVHAYITHANNARYLDAAALLEPALAAALTSGPQAGGIPMFFAATCDEFTRGRSITGIEILTQQADGPAAAVDVKLTHRDGSVRHERFALWRTGSDWRLVSPSPGR